MKVLLVVLALLLACGMLAAHGKLPPAPGLEGSTVANLTAHICDSGRGRGHAAKASTHRLSFSLQVLPAPCLLLRPAGCAPLPRGTEPAPRRPPGRGPCLQLGDPVPARSLQMRAGDSALLGTQPGAAQVPGPRQALLMERGPPRTHLRAGGKPPSCEAASLDTGSEEGELHRRDISAQKNKGGAGHLRLVTAKGEMVGASTSWQFVPFGSGSPRARRCTEPSRLPQLFASPQNKTKINIPNKRYKVFGIFQVFQNKYAEIKPESKKLWSSACCDSAVPSDKPWHRGAAHLCAGLPVELPKP
ncbi:uncharacterized protein LOC118177279 isoform X1 [Oxyura jamaicensis]|uniref:uncharacterized protein LOC118177279 isoform X1 n=1 Tax=Oxyura jamaicensis TaxID=8884 RepID=UPI0015A5CEA4|nr:uncharacterized protein LOC118177279 isoform X1 [Oxyura jamaicensis]XP_035200745.1 uncharacterized protein LOC118177279 isoform X1 [Oxyura jamaicensis]XP_035200746.1 uncharacterized protein LOC118177279 isoform X1 [Oxyura jamaicensis]